VVEVALVCRKVVRLGTVRQPIAGTHWDLREGRKHVELRERERGHTVDARGKAERDEIEPAAAALAPGRRPILRAELTNACFVGALDLGREGALADAGDVGLRNADDAVDAGRADSDARRRGAGDRVRGGDERIRAVVEVEQGSLGAFQQHALSCPERSIDEQRGIRDVGSEPRRVLFHLFCEALDFERLGPVDSLEQDVLLRECGLKLLAQNLPVEDVLDPDPDSRRLVGVGRADPASGRPDLKPAEVSLARRVKSDMPRHDQVGVAGDADAGGREASLFELVQLAYEETRVDDAAGADDAELPGREDARGNVVELERLSVTHDGVPGVRAALVATDDVRVAREEVDDLPLPLVAPLGADDDGRRHRVELRSASGRSPPEGQLLRAPLPRFSGIPRLGGGGGGGGGAEAFFAMLVVRIRRVPTLQRSTSSRRRRADPAHSGHRSRRRRPAP
jgi:hypothetical protein